MLQTKKSVPEPVWARRSVVLATVLAVSPHFGGLDRQRRKIGFSQRITAASARPRSCGQALVKPQKANGQSGYTPMAQGKATTVTEVVADQTMQPFLSDAAVAGMAAARKPLRPDSGIRWMAIGT